jgi:hypothetical protein
MLDKLKRMHVPVEVVHLCMRWIYGHVIGAEMLDKLNATTELVLEQTTPRRVEHRRAMLVRKRTVHSMQAEMDPSGDPKIIKLRLRTQAGTYIKARLLPVLPVITPSRLATGRHVLDSCHYSLMAENYNVCPRVTGEGPAPTYIPFVPHTGNGRMKNV